MHVTTLRIARGHQIRKLLGELAVSIQKTRTAIDRLEQLAGEDDSPVDPDTPLDAFSCLTWGAFSRELAFLDTACLHAFCTVESDFTSTVCRAVARRA